MEPMEFEEALERMKARAEVDGPEEFLLRLGCVEAIYAFLCKNFSHRFPEEYRKWYLEGEEH